jgi:L-alanine-DL-glutamate epimerase-like enolase superfamily enzyme
VHLAADIQALRLARTFEIARGAVDVEETVVCTVEHDGVVGRGEGSPVDYHGETAAGIAAELREVVPDLLGSDPFALEEILGRLDLAGLAGGTRMAVDGALHDWIGRRLGQPTWRLLGLSPTMPPTSFTIGIDSVEGTRERVREASDYRILKVKVGGPGDLERLEVIREAFSGPIRIDGNEGWDLETARAITPDLRRLDIEFVEQPFPEGDDEAYRAYREIPDRLPVVLDESCQTAADVPYAATVADGVNIKIAKTGGIRGAMRLAATARAHGLSVMLGCMIESELGIAQGAQVASLVDYVDLDGHLLIADGPFRGLGFVDGEVRVSEAPGLGVEAA